MVRRSFEVCSLSLISHASKSSQNAVIVFASPFDAMLKMFPVISVWGYASRGRAHYSNAHEVDQLARA
jgi:hypothetical protein